MATGARMKTQFTFTSMCSTLLGRAVLVAYVLIPAALAFAEGGGGGAIDGKGGSGPEPSSLALLGVATGVGLLISKRRGGATPAQEEER